MFTNEQMEKAKACKNVEEFLVFAKENDAELTEEQAKQFFAELCKPGELAENDLEKAVGGINERRVYCPYCKMAFSNETLLKGHMVQCRRSNLI